MYMGDGAKKRLEGKRSEEFGDCFVCVVKKMRDDLGGSCICRRGERKKVREGSKEMDVFLQIEKEGKGYFLGRTFKEAGNASS